MGTFYVTVLLWAAFNTQLVGAINHLLPYDVTQITKTNVLQPKDCTTKLITECPRKRPEPSFKLLKESISFDKGVCAQEWSQTCRKDAFHRRCHWDIHDPFTGSNLEAITLSILFEYECQNKTISMQVLQWSNMFVIINCASRTIELKTGKSCFTIKLENKPDHIHIISQMTLTNGVYESSEVHVNQRKVIKEAECMKNKMPTLAGTMHIGENQEKHSTFEDQTFFGTILFADIFNHNLDTSQRKMEFEYGELIVAKETYPECLCPVNQTCGLADRLMDNAQTIFSPLRAIKDGLLNPKTFFGYWLSPRKEELTIQLDLYHPSLVSKIEIFTFEQKIQVKKRQQSGNFIKLFTAEPTKNRSQAHNATSHKWEDPDKDGLPVLVWSPPHGKRLFVQSLRFSFTYKQGIKYAVIPTDREMLCHMRGSNPIYEVRVYGRSFDAHTSPDKCACFPGNGQGDDRCDKCNMCICRNGRSKWIDSYCSPYIKSLQPNYGPESGGTVVTMMGGLLMPELGTENISVSIGDKGNCSLKSDTYVICRMEKMHSTNTNHLKAVEIKVELLLGEVTYDLQTSFQYTYRPDPVVTDIVPYKSFVFGGSKITIKGKNLDSLDMRHGRKALILQNQFGECKNGDDSTIVCTTPPVGHQESLNASIRLLFDDVDTSHDVRRLGTFHIFPKPEFNVEVEISNGALTLQGQYFDICCNMSEYNISIGGVHCSVVYMTDTLMKCHPGSTSWNGLYGKIIKVELHGLEYDIGYFPQVAHGGLIGMSIALVAVVIITIVSAGIYLWKKNQCGRLSREDSQAHILLNRQKAYYLRGSENSISGIMDGSLRNIIEDNDLDFVSLEILGQIGSGHFGVVFMGHLVLEDKECDVALKAIKGGKKTNTEEVTDFLVEATIMKGFEHPNVLSLMGIIVDGEDIFVVLPYMANGDLQKHVLRKNFDLKTFIGFACDVTNGMIYLSSQKFVHRDLAARNCMVNSDGKVLIGDFGLARDIYEKDYYRPEDNQKPLPYKWMAIECLEDKKFSSMSDVWSLGVTMWEIFTHGAKPYHMVENYNMKSYLEAGHRLQKPAQCPGPIYKVMRECWHDNPEMRPTFVEIGKRLHRIYEAIGKPQMPNERLGTSDIERSPSALRDAPSNTQHLSRWGSDSSCHTVTSFLDPEEPASHEPSESHSPACAKDSSRILMLRPTPFERRLSEESDNLASSQASTSELGNDMPSHTLGLSALRPGWRSQISPSLDDSNLMANIADATDMTDEETQAVGGIVVEVTDKQFVLDNQDNTNRKQENNNSNTNETGVINFGENMDYYKGVDSNISIGGKISAVESDDAEDENEDDQEYGYYDNDSDDVEEDEKEDTAEVKPHNLLQQVQQELRMQVAKASRVLSFSTNTEDIITRRVQPLEPKQFLQPKPFIPQPRKPITRSGCFRHSGTEYVELEKSVKVSQKSKSSKHLGTKAKRDQPSTRRIKWTDMSSTHLQKAPANSAEVEDYLKPA